MQILLAQINPTVGDLEGNKNKILQGISKAREMNAEIVLFPELALSGYPPEDLLFLPQFIQSVRDHLELIISSTKGLAAIVGMPRLNLTKTEKALYNSAAVLSDGQLLGFQDKFLLPTYDVFSERRYFEPGEEFKLWEIAGKKVAITICEDIWQHSGFLVDTSYRCDPIREYQAMKPDFLLNISSSPFHFSKPALRLKVCTRAAKSLACSVLLCNQVGGNDSLIFDGYSMHISGEGKLLQIAKGFEEDYFLVNLEKAPTKPAIAPKKEDDIPDLYKALVLGLHDYFKKLGFSQACLGLSGGIDSALVACLAVDALGQENVHAIAMPSRFSSPESVTDAEKLAHNLGISLIQVPIENPFTDYLQLLEPHFEGKPWDTTEENLQARIRGMILMAFSNKLGYIVLSTGNKSEMAMGYSTLYGDMCGGLGVINDVTKGQVYELCHWINREKEIIPNSTIIKPPSAELRPNQKDTDALPDYQIVDDVLRQYVEEHRDPKQIAQKSGYSLELVMDLVKKIHVNEYKRRQSPPGLRVSTKAFSVGRRFPIVQRWV